MAAVKPIEQSGEKWTRRASVAGPDYQAGVQSPRVPWAAASKAAASNYKAGVTAAANGGRYESGVARAGDERWRTNAMQKGPNRFAEGVQLAVGTWQARFQPYQSAIAALPLPARGPAGSPQNLNRVTVVANALRQVKVAAGGGK